MASRRLPVKASPTKTARRQAAPLSNSPKRGTAPKRAGANPRSGAASHQRRLVAEATPQAPAREKPTPTKTAAPKRAPRKAGAPNTSKSDGMISDASVKAKTGRPLAKWFSLLDGWGAVGRPHREIARHLSEEEGLDGWWAQMITVQYERARGLREVGQTKGGWEVQVQKTLPAPPGKVWAALLNPALRQAWLGKSPKLRFDQGTVFQLPDGTQVEVRRVTAERLLRLKWQAPEQRRSSTLDVILQTNPSGRTTLRFQHHGLSSQAQRSALAAQWQQALDLVAQRLSAA